MQPVKFNHDPMTNCKDETDRLLFDDSDGFKTTSERRAAFGCFRYSKGATPFNMKGSSRIIPVFVVLIAILIPAFLMLMSSCKGKNSSQDLPQTNTKIEKIVERKPELTGIEGQITEAYAPRNNIEKARNATVFYPKS